MASEHPRAGVDYPRNWHELLDWFPDDGACLRYLERLRWGDGFACRFCGTAGGGWWQMADGLRRCAVCRSETSVTAGTIFAGTRTPLVSWFAAVWYVVNQKQGVSALGLQRVLGLGSYQTAWAWLHKLRRAMVRPGRDALEGIVEVDETLIGGVKPGKRGRGADGKALVAVGVEVYESGPGRVRMRRIPDASADTLTEFVLDHVARGAEVHTDAWGGYNDIGRYRFQHVVTNISASGDPAHVVMPEVHRVASLLKRWLLGTHQGAVSHDQLDYYLDEFTLFLTARVTEARQSSPTRSSPRFATKRSQRQPLAARSYEALRTARWRAVACPRARRLWPKQSRALTTAHARQWSVRPELAGTPRRTPQPAAPPRARRRGVRPRRYVAVRPPPERERPRRTSPYR